MSVSPELAKKIAWLAGDLQYMLRPHAQMEMYNAVHEYNQANPNSVGPFVLNCHRRLGKTTLLFILLLEQCLRNPGTTCKFGAPHQNWASDLIKYVLMPLLDECPEELKPRRSGFTFYFKNPIWGEDAQESTLEILGLNISRGDRIRGRRCDWAALDEVALCTDLQYLVRQVFMPMFADSDSPCLLMATTPPDSVDHDFVRTYIPVAEKIGTYLFYPVDNNPDFDDKQREIVKSEGITEDSREWKREFLCVVESDDTKLIIPEFHKLHNKDQKASVQDADERNFIVFNDDDIEAGLVAAGDNKPEHYYSYCGADFAHKDHTSLLYGYHNFEEDILYIEDEIWINYESTGDMADRIKDLEATKYTKIPKKIIRWADATPQQLYDFQKDYGLTFIPTEKYIRTHNRIYDKDAAINYLRTRVTQGKIRIHARCKELIYQLRSGLWNEQRTSFIRSERLGHCDAIDALIYLNRMVPYNKNPFPDGIPDPTRATIVGEWQCNQSWGAALTGTTANWRRR